MTATYLQDNAERLVKGKHVLELGAGAGLPSMVCSILGANEVDHFHRNAHGIDVADHPRSL